MQEMGLTDQPLSHCPQPNIRLMGRCELQTVTVRDGERLGVAVEEVSELTAHRLAGCSVG